MNMDKVAERVAGKFMQGGEEFGGKQLMLLFEDMGDYLDTIIHDLSKVKKELNGKRIDAKGQGLTIDSDSIHRFHDKLDSVQMGVVGLGEALEKMRGVRED
jgi:hypothetical protein